MDMHAVGESSPSISTLFDLTGKAAIVTGSGMGIGQAIALRLAEAGAAVLVADLNTDAAERTAETIIRRDGKALAFTVDIADVAGAQAMVDRTLDAFGQLDLLVNNAGIFPFTPALAMTEAQWDRVLDINLKGTFFAAQAAAKRMSRVEGQRGGRIVNIASVDGLHPTGNLAHYDASKGGVVMLTRALALEFAPLGIAVNAIAPGAIVTPGAQNGAPVPEPGASVQVDDMAAAAFIQRIPMRRPGTPDEIARVALFLASDAASYMTGSLVVVDGGYLLS